MLTGVGEVLGLTYDELILLTPREIRGYLRTGTKPNKDNLLKRKKGYCIFIKDGEEVVIDDSSEVQEFINEFVPVTDPTINQFEGTVASKGFAKGTVKVFLVPEGFSKMNEGDVLVTTMTTPDFVPLMHKAAAIVTDIGGLLCHAAIISREMGKPCVIGTEIATKVLKDGDLVEVDAEKGIVRKIKK